MTKTGKKYPKPIMLTMSDEMHQFLKLLSERTGTSVTDLIRDAIRAYLDEQEGVIGSRSRFAQRIAHQLELDRQHLDRWGTLILAAHLVPFIDRGARGSQVLEQIAKIARQADEQIRGLVNTEK